MFDGDKYVKNIEQGKGFSFMVKKVLPEKVISKRRSEGGDGASLKISERKEVPGDANKMTTSPSMSVCRETWATARKQPDEVRKDTWLDEVSPH